MLYRSSNIPLSQNHLLTTSTSPDGKYEIIIEYETATSFYGPVIVIISCKRSAENFSKEIFKTEVYNDGTAITDYSAKWDKDDAIITLNGDEQGPEIIKVRFTQQAVVILKAHQ